MTTPYTLGYQDGLNYRRRTDAIPVDEVVDFQPAGPGGGVVGLLKSGEQYYKFTLANGRKTLQEVEVKPTD
jgi:hypothetical protein